MLSASHRLITIARKSCVRSACLRRLRCLKGHSDTSISITHAASVLAVRSTAGDMQFIDIGANLTDGMFQGQYMGKTYHSLDLPQVLERAWSAGLKKIIITAGSLPEAEAALKLAQTDERLYCTVGVHPTRCQEIEDGPDGPEAYWDALKLLLKDSAPSGKVVAVGECGLDYDSSAGAGNHVKLITFLDVLFDQFCNKETQQKWFERHFDLAAASHLPMFLHLRAAAPDFLAIPKKNSSEHTRGVVHSFDDSQEVLDQVLAYPGISVGINGCSLKTVDNLAVMANIPAERLLLETDSPYCDVRPSHAGKQYVKTVQQAKDKKKYDEHMLVKGRNEPCNIVSVFEVVSGHRKVTDIEAFAQQIHTNTMQMYFCKTW